jgi:SPP1 gp7 family putative phage head morphogenesis protein
MPSDLERAVIRFRGELLRQERQTASEMVRVYGAAWQRLQDRLVDIRRDLADVANPTIHQVNQLVRVQALRRQVARELITFADTAEGATFGLQRQAVDMAQVHAAALTEMAMGPGGVSLQLNRLNNRVIEQLVGFASDGSPLRDLFAEIGRGVPDAVVDTLATGMASGLHPRVIARLLRRQFGTGLSRALVISRTETMRAYREATRQGYIANRDIVTGWVWIASQSIRTCASCWAMHGTLHTLEETLDDHPNGRCAMAPRTRSWRELGIDVPDLRPTVESGAAIFARLPEADKRHILGPAALEAYQSGTVKLTDFVGRREDPRWGTMRYRRSLKEILGN